MNKYFYMDKKILTKSFILLCILLFISAKLGFVYLLLVSLYLFFHRKKQIDFTLHRSTGKEIFVSPVSGVVKNVEFRENNVDIEIAVSLKRDCGILMPFKGDITSFFEIYSPHVLLSFLGIKNIKISIGLNSDLYPDVIFKVYGLSIFRKPEIIVRAGDRGSTGGLIGYLPYGGKIVISLPIKSEILVSKGDKVTSFQTLISRYKGNNDSKKD